MNPLLLKLSKDKISNVRMNTAIVLKKISKISKNKEVVKEIYSCLEELKRDTDPDVINALNDS